MKAAFSCRKSLAELKSCRWHRNPKNLSIPKKFGWCLVPKLFWATARTFPVPSFNACMQKAFTAHKHSIQINSCNGTISKLNSQHPNAKHPTITHTPYNKFTEHVNIISIIEPQKRSSHPYTVPAQTRQHKTFSISQYTQVEQNF